MLAFLVVAAGLLSGASTAPAGTLTAASGSFALTGNSATLTTTTPSAGTVTTHPLALGLLLSQRRLAAAQGTFVFTGKDATLTPPAGVGNAFFFTTHPLALGLQGGSSVVANYRLVAGTGTFSVSFAPGTPHFRLVETPVQFVLSGKDVTLPSAATKTLAAARGTFNVFAYPTVLRKGQLYRLTATKAVYTLSGQASLLRKGGTSSLQVLRGDPNAQIAIDLGAVAILSDGSMSVVI